MKNWIIIENGGFLIFRLFFLIFFLSFQSSFFCRYSNNSNDYKIITTFISRLFGFFVWQMNVQRKNSYPCCCTTNSISFMRNRISHLLHKISISQNCNIFFLGWNLFISSSPVCQPNQVVYILSFRGVFNAFKYPSQSNKVAECVALSQCEMTFQWYCF